MKKRRSKGTVNTKDFSKKYNAFMKRNNMDHLYKNSEDIKSMDKISPGFAWKWKRSKHGKKSTA